MTRNFKRLLSVLLAVVLIASGLPTLSVSAASAVEIYNGDTLVTDKIMLTEYRSVTLNAVLGASATGASVEWSSNLPLLADVDENGKVTAYDFSKRAIIQLWIDENVAGIPLIGKSTADAIWAAIEKSGVDVDNTDTDTLVWIVSAVVGDTVGNTLKRYLDNMNVEITATAYSANGDKLGSDKVEIVVEKSTIASIAPTGVHITNKKIVPKQVAVGSTVQLFGACTPVRLKQGIEWTVGKNILDTSAKDYASVSADGLVTFLKPGTVTVRVNPESTLYAAFTDTVTFTVFSQEALPVTDFTVSGASSVTEGETIQLTVSDVVPAGAYKGDLTWTSVDENIAVVDANGLVTGIDGGSGISYSNNVDIIARMGNVSKAFTVTVRRPFLQNSLSQVDINGADTVGIDSTETYTSTVSPARYNTSSSVNRYWGVKLDDSDEVVYATDSEPVSNGVISVNANGVVTGVSAGVTYLYTSATYSGSTVTAQKQILSGKAITDFAITGLNGSITEGASLQLAIGSINPTDFEQSLLGSIKWEVADESVATVSANGVLLARDAGGRMTSATRSTTVSATVSGITRTATVTVKGQGLVAVNKFSDANISGNDNIILDFPTSYSLNTYPERIDNTVTYWGVVKDNGSAPWTPSNTYNGDGRNTSNTFISVNDNGTVTPKKAGTTRLYAFTRYLINTNIDTYKTVNVIEVAPESITIKVPSVKEYIEGSVQELDLTGLEVYLNYSKDALTPYYPEAANYTSAQLTVRVNDYTVSDINTELLDTEQYIIVTVSRAGENFNAVFPVTVKSKEVESIDITPPTKFEYFEGDTELSTDGMSVTVNYTNAPSEVVTDYVVNTSEFDFNRFDVEQNVTVSYTHAGRTATGTISVIIYGKPVISVAVNGVVGTWTSENITFNLSSIHQLDGAKYYYQTVGTDRWVMLYGSTHTVSKDTYADYIFKAVNSKGFESDPTNVYKIMVDKTSPSYELQYNTNVFTNVGCEIAVSGVNTGASGLRSFTVNGEEISTVYSFLADENGEYTFRAVSGSGLVTEKTAYINNIDKIAPTVESVTLSQIPADASMGTDGGLYYSGDVVATAQYSDEGVSGVKELRFRLVNENHEPVSDWAAVTESAPAVCDANFKGYFEFEVEDNAGNISASVYSDGFTRDADKPIIVDVKAICGEDENEKEYINDSWADGIVSFVPEATAFSGIKAFYYSMDGGEYKKFTQDRLVVKEDGIHTFLFKAVSYSGLESEPYTFTVKIDRTVPLVRVGFEGTFGRWTSENVTFTLGTLNACPSGVSYYYNCGNGWEKLDGNIAVFTANIDSSYIFKAVNGAGLESAPSDSYRVMIDTSEPTAYTVPSVTTKTSSPYQLAIVPVTGAAGVRKVYFDGVDVTDNLIATVSKNGRYILTVIGNNLLSSSSVVEIKNFGYIPTEIFSYTVLDGDSANITAYNRDEETVTVPFEIANRDTKAITAGAFQDKTALKSVTLQNGIKSIGEVCFVGCAELEAVTIPESVTSIGEHAFEGCENLTIYGYKDSYAQEYANRKNIPFVEIGLAPVGKTEILTQVKTLYTYNSFKSAPEEFVSATGDGYSFVGVPSTVAGSSDIYGTGSKIYVFKDGALYENYKLILMGDLNGDGCVDALDATLAERASNGKAYLYDDYAEAADFDLTSDVEAYDFQQVLNVALR